MAIKIRIDTGGTFTDCWSIDSNGRPNSVKILSSGSLRLKILSVLSENRYEVEIPPNWVTPDGFFEGFSVAGSTVVDGFTNQIIQLADEIEQSDWLDLSTGEEAPVLGARLLTGIGLNEAFPPLDFRLATTRGTNALLERKGAPLALFINEGFGDLLQIGDQRRPDLFALNHIERSLMHREVVEVTGRLDHLGVEQVPLGLSSEAFLARVDQIRRKGITTAAVSLLHSYRNPEHEIALKKFLLSQGPLVRQI